MAPAGVVLCTAHATEQGGPAPPRVQAACLKAIDLEKMVVSMAPLRIQGIKEAVLVISFKVVILK